MADDACSGTATTTDAHHHIPLAQCRKVFVQRDYTRGLAVRFVSEFPIELQGRISPNVWIETVTNINRLYESAEMVSTRSMLETVFGCATCYLSRLCITSQYQKKLNELAKYLEDVNRTIYIPAGLFVTDPMERGLRVLEISFLLERYQPRPIHAPPPPIIQPDRDMR